MFRFALFPALVLAFLSDAAAAFPTYHDYSQYTHWKAQIVVPDDELTFAVPCEILGTPYLATTGVISGLTFYGLGPEGLSPVGSLPLAGIEQDVVVGELYSYVISQPDRLAKVFTANPTKPTLVWTDNLPATPLDLDEFGSLLLIAAGSSGLLIYDATEQYGYPTGTVGTWAGAAYEVKVHGTTVLVRGDDSLTALDLSDPTSPAVLDALPIASTGRLIVSGGLAYVTDHDDVAEVDLGDPANLTLLRTMSTPTVYNYDIRALMPLDGGLLVSTLGYLHYLDLDSGVVTWLGDGVNGPTGSLAMAAAGDDIALACGENGLQIFAWRGPDYPPAQVPFDPGATLRDLQVEGQCLFGYAGGRLYCYYLGLNAPYLAWTHASSAEYEYIETLTVEGDRAYLGYNNGRARVLEYTRSGHSEIAYFQTSGEEVKGLGPVGSYLAVFADPTSDQFREGIVEIYDLTIPGTPVLTDSYRDDDYPFMTVNGTTLVLWDHSSSNNGAKLLDATNPYDLTVAGVVATPEFSEVRINNDHLYLVQPPILQAVDISDPYSVVYGPELDIPNGWYLEVHGDIGYLLYTDLVFDLSDPLVPRPVGSSTNRWASQVHFCAAGEGYLVMGDFQGYTVLGAHGAGASPVAQPLPEAGSDFEFSAFPNPFNPLIHLEFELPVPGAAVFEVFDVRGRRIVGWRESFATAGLARTTWNGRDADGWETPSGTYLVRIRTTRGQDTRKVLLAR